MSFPQRLRFIPAYGDGRALESRHLDDLARWPYEIAQGLAATSLGAQGRVWGILHADDIMSAGGPLSRSVVCRTNGFIWSRWVLLLRSGGVAVLPAGEHDIIGGEADWLVTEPDSLSLECALKKNTAVDNRSKPLFAVAEGVATCKWPVAFLGATAELRDALRDLGQSIRDTLNALSSDREAYRPWLYAAANLKAATPSLTAVPILGALSGKTIAGDDEWPRHDALVTEIRALARLLQEWRQIDDPGLILVNEERDMANRHGRRYRKKLGASLRVIGSTSSALPPARVTDWGVAEVINGREQGLTLVQNVAATWSEFTVRFPAGIPQAPLIFVREPSGKKQWIA